MAESRQGAGRSISAQLRIFPERYKVLFERSLAGFYVATLDGRVLDCNDAFAKLIGYPSRAAVLATGEPVLASADAIVGERHAYAEACLRTKTGGNVWVLRSEALAAAGEDEPLRLGTLVDITERKHAEDALLDRARHMALAAAVGAALTEADELPATLQRCTEALVRHLDAVLARIWVLEDGHDALVVAASSGTAPALPSEPVPVGQGAIGQVADARQPYSTDDIPELGGDLAVWAERAGIKSFAAHPLIVEDRLVGVVAIACRDVLKSGAARALATSAGAIALGIERKHAERALRESERKYFELVEQAPDGILRADDSGRIEFVNPAAERMTGYAAHEMIGRHFADVGVIPAESLQLVFDEFARLLLGEERAPREWQLVRRDGASLTVEASPRPIADGGRIVAVQVILRDVTERLRENARRSELEDQLRQAQKMDAVGRLAGGIAHDFNNLLSVILNYTAILLRELKEHDPIRDDLREIEAAGERGAALTRRLLTFSRKDVVRPVIVDVNETVAEMERLMKRAIGEDIELVTAARAGVARTLIDPGQIEQVLMNLAINARDAMPRGGRLAIETTNVDIRADAEPQAYAGLAPGRYLRIVVRDTGTGMSDDVRSRAFEPFFTTKPKDQGTGLGLATVYGIVQQAKGHVAIQSHEGQGTVVEVLLPATDETPTARLRKIRRTPHRGRGETVLVAEDEDALRTMTCRLLSRSGYSVLEARGPGEALLASERHGGKIDLLLTDVVMPQMSGTELAERLVRLRPDLRVMYMSGYANDVIATQFRDGNVLLLEKPFTEEALLARVREAIDGPAA